MISFFRRLINSKVGLVFMLGFLGLIAFAFVAADLGNTGFGGGTAARGGTVGTVGSTQLGEAELTTRVRREYEAARRQQPELAFADYLAGGAVEAVMDRMLSSYAIDGFARSQGMTVSRAMEVAEIQRLPGFRGLDGNFDRATFDAALRQLGLSEGEFREELAREMLARQLLIPVSGAARAPDAIVRAHADLLLEQRSGSALFVRAAAIDVPAPTDAQIAEHYRRNVARYTVPERRVVRYALVDRATLAVPAPTEAEIAAAYRAAAARFGARETRTLTQVILPDEAAARALAQRVGGGAAFAAAAGAAGLEPATLRDQSREGFAGLSSAAVAAAAFGANEGAVTAPTRSGLGWHVVRVDAIQRTAATPLDAARPTLITELTAAKRETALSDLVARIQDQVGGGATFAEATQAAGIPVVTSAPLFSDGRSEGSTATPEPLAVQLATAAFGSTPDDDPVIQEIVPEQSYAFVDLVNVLPAAAPPLTGIRDRVVADTRADRALAEARRIATAIATRAEGATSLAQAASGAGATGAPTTVSATRQQLGGNLPPETAALFSLRRGGSRAFAAPDGSGWWVVKLTGLQRGNAAGRPDLVQATQQALGSAFGSEYADQFVAAARVAVGTSRDAAAIARVRGSLTGGE